MALQKETATRLRKSKFGKEFLVGLLGLSALVLMVFFGWLMGAIGPFSSHVKYVVMYGFAGGVEVGSPVRVSGVKVGRVESIAFVAKSEDATEDEGTLRVTVTVSQKAAPTVRQDSKFFINMAGIIGERYVEISPGSLGAPALPDGSVVRGVDPPRIDQLLSQGYAVFGRVQEFLERNETNLTSFLNNLEQLMADANKLFQGQEKRRLFRLADNLVVITDDMKKFTKSLSQEKADKFFDQLAEIINRTHSIDEKVLRDFLQEEGIRARIF